MTNKEITEAIEGPKTNCLVSHPYPNFTIYAESDEQALAFEKVLRLEWVGIKSTSRDQDKVGIRSFTVGRDSEIKHI